MRSTLSFGATFAALAALAVGCQTNSATAADADQAAQGKIALTAKDLYSGFEARKVALDKEGAKLLLDARVFKFGKEKAGVVVTDPIGLLGAPGGLANGYESATAVEVDVTAEVPDGAAVEVETRSGGSFFDQSNWSEWKKLDGLKGKVEGLAGRYLQVKLTLKAAAADKLPAVTGLALAPERTIQKIMLHEKMEVTDSKIQHIVRSPIDFQYERPDQPKLAKFRKDNNLDEVVAGAKDDFEKLVRLMDWVGSCNNVRKEGAQHETFGGVYQWDIEKVFELREVEKDGKKVMQPNVFGHCMSYAEVLVTAATSMGYVGSRHMAKEGYNQRSHEVCDIWVPSLGKWVYFDPSLTSYYMDKETKQPLNLIEAHEVVMANFVPEGKDTAWFAAPGNGEARAQVKKVGGKTPIECRLGKWCYGAPMEPNYDWGTKHGYMCSGFVQMTPRNDFNSHPEANPKKFGSYPGYAGYPFWVDDKTNPKKGVSNWYTRMRDFYWTLDQASFKIVRTGDDEVALELGNSMPFFKKYLVKVDGAEVKDEVKSPFIWKLKAGENKIEVAPVDEFGKIGLASTATIKLGN